MSDAKAPEPEPEPEPEEVKEQKKDEDVDADNKDDSKEPSFRPERIPKDDPGDGLPQKTPDFIEFKWNKEMKTKKKCDTQHMLFLLQLALNLVRLRTIERNKYFKSIGRTDRFINQLDSPQIITNFLDWHNADKEKNKFDGELLEGSEKLFMINDMISDIGDTKKGPATKIFTKLKKDVVIETTTWLELPQPKLKLKNWGYNKMYKGEKVIDECTVEEIIQLLTYVNDEEEKKGDDKYVQGVFAVVIAQNEKKGKSTALEQEAEWQKKVIKFFRDNKLDGNTFITSSVKVICQNCMDALIAPEILNKKGKPENTKLRGGVNQILRALKNCYVNAILTASK